MGSVVHPVPAPFAWSSSVSVYAAIALAVGNGRRGYLAELVAVLLVLVHLVVRDSLAGHAAYLRFVFEGPTVAPPPGPARFRPLTGQGNCRQPLAPTPVALCRHRRHRCVQSGRAMCECSPVWLPPVTVAPC